MNIGSTNSRRLFLTQVAAVVPTVLFLTLPTRAEAAEKNEANVGPAEDLMREHGALNRILLIYDEAVRKLRSHEDFDPEVVKKSAGIVHSFIEGYHEKLEEEHIFPRMKKQKKLAGLVETLDTQHKAGRKVTEGIENLSTAKSLKSDSDRTKLTAALEAFTRMYRPHESREDTELFPEFHESLSEKEYDELGEKFEEREHQLFGQEGFERIVAQIAELEKAMGIADLAKVTPRTPA